MMKTELGENLNEKKHRLLNCDLLRLAAAYLIVVLHLSVQYINKAPASMEEYMVWQQAVKISAVSRIGVPLFVMLSGAFLLGPDRKITLPVIFRKYLPKLVAIFLLWSAFYTFKEQKDWTYFVQGHYHMWYLYLMAGLYLFTPLFKHITEHATKAQMIYFVVLCAVVTSLEKLNEGLWENQLLDSVMGKLSLSVFFGYIGYFAAGWLFRRYTPSWPVTGMLAVLGIAAFRYTYMTTWELNPMFGFESPNLVFFSNYSPTVFLMSFAVFAVTAKLGVFTEKLEEKGFLRPLGAVIGRLAKYLLVVYLVHPAVISYCREAELLQNADTAASLLENALIVYFISLFISMLLTEALAIMKKTCCLVLRKIKC